MQKVRINFGLSDRWVELESLVSVISQRIAETKFQTQRLPSWKTKKSTSLFADLWSQSVFGLGDGLSERLIQKVKSPNVSTDSEIWNILKQMLICTIAMKLNTTDLNST